MNIKRLRCIPVLLSIFLPLLVIVTLIAACQDKKSQPQLSSATPITLAVSKTPLSSPIYIAHSQGYFAKYGVNVKLKELVGGHRCLKSVLNDEADLATTSDYPIMINSFKRNDFVVTATFVSSQNDVKLIARKGVEISNIADFKGKKVGTVTGASSHYFLDRALLLSGVSLDQLDVKHIQPEAMPQALLNREVDALSVWEPYAYLTRKLMGNNLEIFPVENLYRETFNLVAKDSFISDHPDDLKHVLSALKDAVQFIQNKPIDAQNIVMAHLELDSEFINWIWPDFDFKLSLEQSLIITMENEARWAIKQKIVKAKNIPNFLEFMHTQTLRTINPSAVSIIQ